MEEKTEEIIPLEGGFWGFFGQVIKKSKGLFFMGVFVSLMWMVTAIFTNTLQLSELTYFNVLVSIMLFCDIFSFATAQAFIIMLSQKKDKYKQALNFCSFINIGIMLVVAVFLFAAKDFILLNLFKLDSPGDSLFYYLMIGFIIFRCITRYYETTMRGAGLTKQIMISTLITFLAMMSGWAILILTDGFALNYIPIIFYVSQALSFAYTAFAIKREKGVNIFNIFSLEKPTKEDFKMVFEKLAFEVFWQIGYTVCTMFMLKLNVKIYDSYMYFENALDIFNVVYFAFMYVTSVQVAIAIGEERTEDAFKISKYSVYISMITWVGYFVLAGIVCYPILLGVNPELFEISLQTYFIYTAVYFFRFIAWCMSSYCISMSGRNLAQIIIQCFSVTYYFALYFTAQYLPNNVFFVYVLLILEVAAVLITETILFFRKGWLRPKQIKKEKQE